MYLKTTSPQFLKYGQVQDHPSNFKVHRFFVEGKVPQYLKSVSVPVTLEVLEGIALVVILDPSGDPEQFVIHRIARLNPDIPYTVIPLTQSAVIEESIQSDGVYTVHHYENEQEVGYLPIRPKFYVTDIFSYYYSVKGKNYHFSGESHFYWEITYVDTGELVTEIDGKEFKLESQSMMLYFPNQFHKQRIEGDKSCSYLTIMFDMNINVHDIDHIKNKVFTCTQEMYNLFNSFIKHSTILETYNVPYSRDLMISYLQELIILVIQYDSPNHTQHLNSNPIQANFENELVNEINKYILNNICEPISVEDLCDHFAISRSSLQVLFKKNMYMPPKQYINDIKMMRAQVMILEENLPITEVAMRLGFSSIHYFSRKFKKQFGLSPTEYAQSLYNKNTSDD